MKTLSTFLLFSVLTSSILASDPIPRLAADNSQLLNRKRTLQGQIAAVHSSIQSLQSQHDRLLRTNQQHLELQTQKLRLRSDLLNQINLASQLR